MAWFKLFLDEPVVGSLGKGGTYHYEDGVLEVGWWNKKSWHSLPPQSAVIVKCERGPIQVVPLTVPKGYCAKILWLCGVPAAARCKSVAEYDGKVAACKVSGVKHECGQGWQIASVTDLKGRRFVVAGWVDPKITEKNRRKMIRTCGTFAPDWYIRKVLGGR